MCGIAGIIDTEPREDVVRAMCRAIAHRGPDGEGVVVRRAGGRVATLGHRRLSIVDLSTGAQPMEDVDRRAIVTFNGEIYDHRRTRARLMREHGVRFATESDTEVIVSGFAHEGERIVSSLHGMFAFCAFDQRDGTVLLARDRSGIKPLYVAHLPNGAFAFSSELSALFSVPEVKKKVSDAGLASFLFSDYAHPPHTLIEGVEKLAPGELWIGRVGRAWERRSYVPADVVGPAPSAAELWSTLGDAVEAQLMSDVPLGVFLSGGLDSSCIAALAARSHARAGSKTKLQAFCIAFDEQSFDESAHARRMSAHLGLEHVEEKLGEDALLSNVDRVLDHLDEPLGDHSIVPTYLLCKLAARHVKVALGGDGADELFGGYPTYRAHVLHARSLRPIAPLFRSSFARRLLERIPSSDRYQSLDWKVKRFLGRWDDDVATRHLRWMSALDLPELREAMGTRFTTPATLALRPHGIDPIAIATALDFATYLPGSVLTKVDRASMAHGLEARPPFLDENVVALARRVPSRDKVRGSTSKWLLRRAASDVLPSAILERTKHGFSIPLAAWLRGPLAPRVTRILHDSPCWSVLERGAFARYARAHALRRGDHAKSLWALVVLDAWMRRHGVAA